MRLPQCEFILKALTLSLFLNCSSAFAPAQIFNLRLVTDASPDYSDLPSLIHSVTAKWPEPEQKCWAMFYWNHIARRQTAPMIVHGTELTDPIRQFNDYGYTMCSTISGINCALWHNMGLPVKFWDITLHTVPEVFYDQHWHMYDNSMSAIYTLCDGKTIASVQEIGREGACVLSKGVREPAHIAKYHCLYSTGPNGFLTGADTQRSVDEEARCFNPNGLKYRDYYFNWDYGHRYILNLKADETYTRFYKSLGKSSQYYVSHNGKDPDERYGLRGNGRWSYQPQLTNSAFLKDVYSYRNVRPGKEGLETIRDDEPAEVIIKTDGANVIASQIIEASFSAATEQAKPSIALSKNNGKTWDTLWKASAENGLNARVLVDQEINGAYSALIKFELAAGAHIGKVILRELSIQTTTMLNAKTQPKLNLGRNTIYVSGGDQTDSLVVWPDLEGNKYKADISEEHNISSTPNNPGYQGTIYPAKPAEDAYLVYRLEAPRNIRRVNFGGRFYNRAPGSHIDLMYSVDQGKSWTKKWSLRRTAKPWDVIHYEEIEIPPGQRSVLIKYLMNTKEASPAGCSIYAVRMEATFEPLSSTSQPLLVTFNWSEQQPDRSVIPRSHTQTVEHMPFKYTINVGGADHPVMESLSIKLKNAQAQGKGGYSDGKDPGGAKFVPKWIEYGENVAMGKTYALSEPSLTNWGAGDEVGRKLTTGAGGPSYAGGTSYASGALWKENANPIITLDLEKVTQCASFGLNFHGYPWWDALKGQVKDSVQVLTSIDGKNYESQGFLNTNLRWIDLPVNYMWPDDESITSATFRFIPKNSIAARYVKFQVKSPRMFACAGIEVLNSVTIKPFDLRIALPDEIAPIANLAPLDNGE